MVTGIFARSVRAVIRSLRNAGAGGSDSAFGAEGEELAYWYLRERGFTIVARNYRRAGLGGEVDLIGWDGGTLVFVEVKARHSAEVRRAEDAVDREKRRHLVAAGRDYRRRAQVQAPHRYDVISIYSQPAGGPVVEHFRDAFTEAEVLL